MQLLIYSFGIFPLDSPARSVYNEYRQFSGRDV